MHGISRKELHRAMRIPRLQMEKAIRRGETFRPAIYLGSVLDSLYCRRSLSKSYLTDMQSFADSLLEGGYISRGDILSRSDSLLVVEMPNDVWTFRLQNPSIFRDAKCITAYGSDYDPLGLAVRDDFASFFTLLDCAIPAVLKELTRVSLGIRKRELIREIGEAAAFPAIDGILGPSGYEYTCAFHGEDNIEIRIRLHCGRKVRIRYSVTDLNEKIRTLPEDLLTLEEMLGRYGRNIFVGSASGR